MRNELLETAKKFYLTREILLAFGLLLLGLGLPFLFDRNGLAGFLFWERFPFLFWRCSISTTGV